MVFAAGILTNVCFLFVRALIPQSIKLTTAQMFTSARTDYLESQTVLTGLLTTFVVPAVVNFAIHWQCVNDPTLSEDYAKSIAASHFKLAIFQSISMVFLIFVPLFRCPLIVALDDVWATWVPFLHALLTGFTFILIPIYVMATSLTMIRDLNQSPFRSPLWIYFFTSLVVFFVWFPQQVYSLFTQAYEHYVDHAEARAIKR